MRQRPTAPLAELDGAALTRGLFLTLQRRSRNTIQFLLDVRQRLLATKSSFHLHELPLARGFSVAGILIPRCLSAGCRESFPWHV